MLCRSCYAGVLGLIVFCLLGCGFVWCLSVRRLLCGFLVGVLVWFFGVLFSSCGVVYVGGCCACALWDGLFKVDACLCFCSYGCLAVCWLRVMVVIMGCLLVNSVVLFSFVLYAFCLILL